MVPFPVWADPCHVQILAERRIVAGKTDDIAVKDDVLVKRASNERASVAQRQHRVDEFVTEAASGSQPPGRDRFANR